MEWAFSLRIRAVALLVIGLGAQGALAQDKALEVTDVTCVDVATGKLLPHRYVLIRGGVIVQVSTRSFKSASRVSGKGMFLIPGLWDMHVHTEAKHRAGWLALSNGITGMRDMGCEQKLLPEMRAMRSRWESGREPGPHLVFAGPVLDGAKPVFPDDDGSLSLKSPKDGRSAVRRLKAQGVDFIKVYSVLEEPTFNAVVWQAHQLGLEVCGHVSVFVGALRGARTGMRSEEHGLGLEEACTREFPGKPKSQAPVYSRETELQAQIESNWDDTREKHLFDELKADETWLCPTFSVTQFMRFDTDPVRWLQHHPGTPYYPEIDLKEKAQDLLQFNRPKATKPETPELASRQWKTRTSLIVRAFRAGVGVLAGTDDEFSGTFLAEELRLMVEAGLTPAEALRTATIEPAKYFKQSGKRGEIKPGQAADLVLLDQNPLVNISNVRQVSAVIMRGKVFTSHDLDALRKGAREDAMIQAKKGSSHPRDTFGIKRHRSQEFVNRPGRCTKIFRFKIAVGPDAPRTRLRLMT